MDIIRKTYCYSRNTKYIKEVYLELCRVINYNQIWQIM